MFRRRINLGIIGVCLVIVLALAIAVPAFADLNYPDFGSAVGMNLVQDAALADSRLRLTAGDWTTGAGWAEEKQQVQDGFETLFEFQFTQPGAWSGDGFAFVIQSNNDLAIGGWGGGNGFGDAVRIIGSDPPEKEGIPNSLVVEFDTIDNTPIWHLPDGPDNHISVQTRGTTANSADHTYSLGSTSVIPDMSDWEVHTVKIQYAPGTMSIFIDDLDNACLSVAADLGSVLDLDDGKAWVGFTASSAVAYQNHDILSWSFKEIAEPSPLEVAIDIKPGSAPNSVNLKAKGVLPVGILGSEDFDVQQVDMTSLALAGSSPKPKGKSGKLASYKDLNGDSILDLILHFPIPDLDIEPEAEDLTLTGMLLDGTEITGSGVARLLHPMDGDANLDGKVSIADLCVMAGSWNQTGTDWADADFNGDGKVSIGDLTMLAGNWGGTSPLSISEPATLSLLAVAGGLLVRRRRVGH